MVVRDECDAAVASPKFELKPTNPATKSSHFSPAPGCDQLNNQGKNEDSPDAKSSTNRAFESNTPAGDFHQPPSIGVEPKELGTEFCATTAQPSVSSLLPPSRPPVQSQGKPRLNPNSRFHSQQEMDDFYQALKQLGKSKGISQPSAWAIAIIKGINSEGLPCEYLDEFRAGQMLGASEQEEWECEPGKPWPTFITFLTRRLKKTGLSDEEAISKAYATLRNRNQAQDLWA